MKKIFTLLAVAAMSVGAYAQNYTVTAVTSTEDIWGENYLAGKTVTVEGYDDYVIIRSVAGVEGYDMQVNFDESWNVTSLNAINNGVALDPVTSGYGFVLTGADDWYLLQPYVGAGYSYAYQAAGWGYVLIWSYFYDVYDNSAEGAYYVEWQYTEEQGVVEPNYTCAADVAEYASWGTNYAAPADATVESYDGYVIVRAIAGVEGYDMKVAYDADWNVTGITPIVDGEEGDEVTSDCATVYTGLDEWYCLQPYVGSGYGYVYDSGTSGYVLLGAYWNSADAQEWGCYYVEWTKPEEVNANYTSAADVAEYASWGTNYAAPADATVESYDGYVIVRAITGVEGYDMKVSYDADWNVTGITPIVDGEEGDEVTSGYATVYTGLEEWYCLQPYVGSNYGYVYDSGTSGYVLLGAYWNSADAQEWGCYYVEWPAAEKAPELVASYEALSEVSDMSYEVQSTNGCTISEYDNGEYRVQNFLGAGYTGANFSFKVVDNNVVFTEITEGDYGATYVEVLNNETQEYIQVYLYDMNGAYGEDFSACYLGVKDEANGYYWGNHAYMVMYSEELCGMSSYGFGYLDLYWDNLGEVPAYNYSAVADVAEYSSWGTNYAAPTKTVVESYDDYVILRAITGVEGYDMKVAYDADWNVTGITPIVDGEEGDEVTSGYATVYTGLEEWYCLQPYVGSNYGYVYDNGSSEGYVLLGAYWNSADAQEWGCYYAKWPALESGISSVESENAEAVEYYNLNGVRVVNPSRGIYIVKQGAKVSKQVIR